MQHFQIRYYSERVEDDILKLPLTIKAKYFQYTDMLEEFGANLGMPLRDATYSRDGRWIIRT